MSDPRTLPEALSRAAESGTGFIFLNDGQERHQSYAEIQQSAFRVARSIAESGLARHDLVAIVVNDAEQFLTSLFGATIAGVVPASLYPPSTTSELPAYFEQTARILRSSGARAVITSAPLKDGFERLRSTCPDLSLVLDRAELDAPPVPPDVAVGPGDLALVQFTSGSTSLPKGIAITHGSLSMNVLGIIGLQGLNISAGDVAVSWLPLFHDMGLVGMALGALYAARPSVLMSPYAFVKRPVEWLRAISRHAGTVSFAPNFAYDLCLRRVKDRDFEGLDLSGWRVAGCGAEPIHAGTLRAFAEKFAAVGFSDDSFVPSYGLAEHVVAASFSPRGRALRTEAVDADALTEERVARAAADDGPSVALVSCGGPLPGHRIRIVGEDGRELPPRQVGEITLAGPSVMLGYYRDDTLTARTVRDGWLHTGDLGYLADGELFVCGRAKDIIIVNGRKYHPQDLEWAVDQVAGVRRGRVVAFGTGQAADRERVVVVAEPNGTAAAGDLMEAIRRSVGDRCGLYVDDVVLVPSGTVGRTTSGKVQRAATKARYERGELSAAHEQRAGVRA